MDIIRDGKLINPKREAEALVIPAKAAELEALEVGYELAASLELTDLVTLEEQGILNTSDLKRLSKTAHWLYRNLK